MKVAEQLVRCLENEGVEYIFGVPGEENEALLFALEGSKIRFVPTRHEQGAAFIADVWGRLTGRAGVCLSTLGPGATNLLTGVADAHLDKAPLVAITAQGGLGRLHHESHQYLDVVTLFRPVTRWNSAIKAPQVVSEVVRKAFKLAQAEKPGATHIELSEDIAELEVPAGHPPLRVTRVRRSTASGQALDEALALLARARRPLVLAGNGAIRRRASAQLRRFCETYRVPALATFMAKGAVADDSDLSLMTIGQGFRGYCMAAVEQADLVMTVGYDIAEYAPEQWNPHRRMPIVHLDFTPAEVYTHYNPEVELVGDISDTLAALHGSLASLPNRFEDDWWLEVRRRLQADIDSYRLAPGQVFTVPGTLGVLEKHLGQDGLLISDVGSHKLWIARNYRTCRPNGCLISNGLASMGIALPGAIAACLADPERPVVATMGDGGFLMNVQELETATRLGIGFTGLVFNDNDYGLISWKQALSRGRSVFTRIGNPDFTALAKSFGIKAYRPRDIEELDSRLEESIRSREMRLIEVSVDPAVNTELNSKLKGYWNQGD